MLSWGPHGLSGSDAGLLAYVPDMLVLFAEYFYILIDVYPEYDLPGQLLGLHNPFIAFMELTENATMEALGMTAQKPLKMTPDYMASSSRTDH